ncbi:N-acetylglucosamine-6-phosphate deacetylase [Halobacillus shinanisalinarum]|uniref:N-acetylglucosamine-6-phosphate deacetylase n=1 Tax=Halobacillus shinanisalinarum TaxID=2932258 RepID=A0ABY4GUM5_9BACI|nr:N-acetylglucosamine-6-phosphate deacetylase [Halobacillus shinanisalinarum]UOQ91729.1 N-acetylglucosamine-6-phosphate deacetylase [Halobacillus shinanisalinarum]
MSETIEFTNIMIITETKSIESGCLQVKNGKIIAISDHPIGGADSVIDGKGESWTLVPGFIDVHIHGADGYDVMDASNEALAGMADRLPEEGTTSFLATTMTQSKQNISRAVRTVGEYMKQQKAAGQAEILGVHLEGPFISQEKAGAQPLEHIVPSSIEQFAQWHEESGDNIRLVTLAPESQGGIDLIKYLSAKGIVASIGHSQATFDQVTEAVQAGARHVTHLYNQMSGLHHREPGIVGAAFLNEKLMVEMIVDHVHARPEAVQLAYHHTKADRTILITDAMRAKCLPEGTYDLGGQNVNVEGNEARLPDGTLAGSILTLEQAVSNMKQNNDISMEELVRMTSTNAANQLGIGHRKGIIAEGKDADLVILDENLSVVMTVCRGVVTHDHRRDTT